MSKMVMLVFLLLFLSAHSRICTPSEVTVELTHCLSNSTRSVLFSPTSPCSAPPPQTHLSCSLPCGPGTYLGYDRELKQSKCELCPANTYSSGGGIRFAGNEETWTNLQSQFITYCYISELFTWLFRTDCESWTPTEDGSELVSGNTSRKAWVVSEFVYYAKVVKAGNFTVQYRKKNRMYEGLPNGIFSAYINEEQVLFDDFLSADSYRTVSFPLNPGVMEIQLQYEKYNTAGFEDLDAHIRLLEVTGTQPNALHCSPCIGGYSSIGAAYCSPCPANTYFNGTACAACPTGSYSLEGSKEISDCKAKIPCKSTDYREEMTGCREGTSTRTYIWLQPHICDEVLGLPLPAPVVNLSCDLCSPGYFHSAVSHSSLETNCAPCPPGTSATEVNATLTSCTTCAAGTFASRVLNFTQWLPLPPQVSNDCRPYTGEVCSETSGWLYTSSGLTSGNQLTANVYLTLGIFTTIVEKEAYLVFSWSMGREYGSSSRLAVEIDGNTQLILNSAEFQRISQRFHLSLGPHVIRLIYHHSSVSKASEEWCMLHWVAIKGSDTGGAPACEICPNGHFSSTEMATCKVCPAGSTSNAERTDCVKCPGNAYSDIEGNSEGCMPCPSYTIPNSNRTYCIGMDTVTVNQTTWAIGNFTGLNVGGLCTLDQFALSCIDSFYGPVHSPYSDFYISVLNPAPIHLDIYANYDNTSLGYAYGLIPKSDLSLTGEQLKVPDSACVSNGDKLIVNLGSRVNAIIPSPNGLNISYINGSRCGKSGNYSLLLSLVCNKTENEGFPEYIGTVGCNYQFQWRSRLACPICSRADMSEIRSPCREGIRYIYYVEGRNCIVKSDQQTLYFIESCTAIGEVLSTTATLVIISIVLGLLLLALVVLSCFCKVNTMYRRLLEQREGFGHQQH